MIHYISLKAFILPAHRLTWIHLEAHVLIQRSMFSHGYFGQPLILEQLKLVVKYARN